MEEALTLIYDILVDLCKESVNYNQCRENRMIELRQIIDDLHTPPTKEEPR